MHWFKSFAKKCTQNVASVTLFLDILLDCEFQSDHKEIFVVVYVKGFFQHKPLALKFNKQTDS